MLCESLVFTHVLMSMELYLTRCVGTSVNDVGKVI